MRIGKRFTFFFGALLLGLLLLGVIDSRAEVNFRTEAYIVLKKEALKQRRLILIDFRADWCKPCIEMEKTTFLDSTLSEYVNRQFISIKADVDFFDGMDLQEKFNVNQLPTIIIVEPEYEDIMFRLIGKKNAIALTEELRNINRPEYYDEIPPPAKLLKSSRISTKKDKIKLNNRVEVQDTTALKKIEELELNEEAIEEKKPKRKKIFGKRKR